MVNCTAADVRRILNTGLVDSDLDLLIAQADAEMTARGLTTATWTTDLKKQVSALIAASLAAMNDARSRGKAGSQVGEGRSTLSKWFRECAEGLISSTHRVTGKVVSTPYEHIDEDDRYQEDLR
jgi:hypothetical protein